jgi:hypothetical protein
MHQFVFESWQYPRANVGHEREPKRSIHAFFPRSIWKPTAEGFADLRDKDSTWRVLLEMFSAVEPTVDVYDPVNSKGKGKKRDGSDDEDQIVPEMVESYMEVIVKQKFDDVDALLNPYNIVGVRFSLYMFHPSKTFHDVFETILARNRALHYQGKIKKNEPSLYKNILYRSQYENSVEHTYTNDKTVRPYYEGIEISDPETVFTWERTCEMIEQLGGIDCQRVVDGDKGQRVFSIPMAAWSFGQHNMSPDILIQAKFPWYISPLMCLESLIGNKSTVTVESIRGVKSAKTLTIGREAVTEKASGKLFDVMREHWPAVIRILQRMSPSKLPEFRKQVKRLVFSNLDPDIDISDPMKSLSRYVHGEEWDLPMKLYEKNHTYEHYQDNLMSDLRSMGTYYMTMVVLDLNRARTSVYGMEPRLRANIRLNSIPGVGKSFATKILQGISLPGCVEVLSGDSDMGTLFTNNDDKVICYDELTAKYNLLRHKMDASTSKAYLLTLQALNDNTVKYNALHIDAKTGKRSVIQHETYMNTVIIGNSNEAAPKNAMTDRFRVIKIAPTWFQRKTVKELAIKERDMDMDSTSQLVRRRHYRKNAYEMILKKLISFRAIPRVNVLLCRMYVADMNDTLNTLGFDLNMRGQERIVHMAESEVIQTACDIHFFGRTNHYTKRLDMDQYDGIEDLLYLTEDMTINILTSSLCEWIPPLHFTVVRFLASRANDPEEIPTDGDRPMPNFYMDEAGFYHMDRIVFSTKATNLGMLKNELCQTSYISDNSIDNDMVYQTLHKLSSAHCSYDLLPSVALGPGEQTYKGAEKALSIAMASATKPLPKARSTILHADWEKGQVTLLREYTRFDEEGIMQMVLDSFCYNNTKTRLVRVGASHKNDCYRFKVLQMTKKRGVTKVYNHPVLKEKIELFDQDVDELSKSHFA